MTNNFVKQTLAFLNESDLGMLFPGIHPVSIGPDEVESGQIHACYYLSRNQIANNDLLALMVVFGLLDALVDLYNPHLEGKSFKQRYDGLPRASDADLVFREMYRIFKMLRNATIHAKSALSISSTGVAVDYQFSGTRFQLNCGKITLSLLYSLVVIYAERGGSFNLHGEGVLRNYYDAILGGITAFSDEYGGTLVQLNSSGLRLSWSVRYIVHNSAFTETEDGRSISITRYSGIPDEYRGLRSADHVIHHSGEIYVIPEEVITASGEIPITALVQWSWEGSKPVTIKDWSQLLTKPKP